MNKELFVQNIKFYCARKNVKPTVACREAGVSASFISNIEGRGQTPSVEKVQMLAQYLGVTVSELLGENSKPQTLADLPEKATLRDFTAPAYPPNVIRFTVDEVKMVIAYRDASADDKMIVDAALRKYKEKESAPRGTG